MFVQVGLISIIPIATSIIKRAINTRLEINQIYKKYQLFLKTRDVSNLTFKCAD